MARIGVCSRKCKGRGKRDRKTCMRKCMRKGRGRRGRR